MQRDHNLLFYGHDMYCVLEHQKQSLSAEVNALQEHKLLNCSVEDLVAYFEEKYWIDVPVLDVENAAADQKEAQVEVSGFGYGLDRGEAMQVTGTQVTLDVPFTGDSEMFKVQPSTYTLNPPRACVGNGILTLSTSGTNLSGDQVQAEFDNLLCSIQRYLDNQKRDADGFNGQLGQIARSAIEQRREKLLANQNLVAGLSFKMKERSDAPKTYSSGLKRRKIEPQLPPASSAPYKPEPVLPDTDYQNILKIIEDMTLVMERSPSSFVNMPEEDIRQHYLVQLNGHFEGKATGETFNASGKTDILVRDNGKNIFIAECKFWRGDKSYMDTIDQILSYLSWRDTKTAIILFNKNKDFSGVLEKVKELTTGHSNCKSGPVEESETRFRFVFGQANDPSRETTLTVLCFDMPVVYKSAQAEKNSLD